MLSNLAKIISLSAILVFLSFLFSQLNLDVAEQTANISQPLKTDSKDTAVIEEKAVEEPIHLEAKSACVFDLLKKEYVFELKPEAQLPLASLTKLATMMVAKEELLPDTLIEISLKALLMDGDTGLKVGEFWKLDEIIKIMLISSSNDAAFAIASALKSDALETDESTFIKLMNKKARELELNQTYFLNSTGLDISETVAGAYGSCKDITKLMQYALDKYQNVLEITSKESLIMDSREFKNTNKLLPQIHSLFGSKTGFDDLAGGNLTVVVDGGLNRPLIITVLGSTLEGRFKDVEILYNKYINGT